jgi:hypothetical protein
MRDLSVVSSRPRGAAGIAFELVFAAAVTYLPPAQAVSGTAVAFTVPPTRLRRLPAHVTGPGS